MSDPCAGMAQPTAEHARLLKNVGTWNVACTYHMGPETMTTTGRDTCVAVGGFWTVSRFETEMMGAPFAGVATTGYDPDRKLFVATWVDSMNPRLCQMEGRLDGDTLKMGGTIKDPMSGQPVEMKSEEKPLDENRRSFRMWMGGNLVMEYVYTRAK